MAWSIGTRLKYVFTGPWLRITPILWHRAEAEFPWAMMSLSIPANKGIGERLDARNAIERHIKNCKSLLVVVGDAGLDILLAELDESGVTSAQQERNHQDRYREPKCR
jgi:hypothetical protein